MLPKFLCWLLGHKRFTRKVYMGVLYGREEMIYHKDCPRCGESLQK